MKKIQEMKWIIGIIGPHSSRILTKEHLTLTENLAKMLKISSMKLVTMRSLSLGTRAI